MEIKIICGQMEVIPGRPDLNYNRISEIITDAKAQGADLLLLPEMALPGYLIGDLWEQQTFLDDCAYYTEQLVAQTQGICVLFGSVAAEPDKLNEDGRLRKYNAAYVAQNGKLLGGYQGRSFIMKNSLPNYREFDDCRYFYSLQKLCAEEYASVEEALQPVEVEIRGERLRLGVMLCEDGWTENYHLNVPQTLAHNGAQLLCNLSCSPYTLGKNRKRNRLFSAQAKAAGIPLIYCNNVGIQNNGKNIFTYDGCTSAYNGDGTLVTSAEMYADTLLPMSWETASNTIIPTCPPATLPEEPRSVYQALKYGTTKFLAQCGIKKMTIGLSGGIDSAITAAMYADILGPENILLVNIPSRYNSTTTREIAYKLAKALGANYAVLPITESYELTVEQLTTTPMTHLATGKEFHLELSTLVKENIQARDRGARLIAAASAAFGSAFSCNSNKAEISVGYATFYGDIAGALAMIGDLWKHQVYALGRYLNAEVFKREVIPEEIFTIRPSAELSEAQTVGKGGDPLVYPYHDYLLRAFIENWHKTTPADILRWYKAGVLAEELGCTEESLAEACPTAEVLIADLERWWRLFAGFAVAKRIQAPPILSLTKRAFGYDHREAQLSPYFSREYYQLKEELLHHG
ncbi:MAG: NAD(+) synthase [Phascolarctobacterium sp.]|nr:NAD(+) synthase [Phascolarctobacterium sp.]